MMHLSLAVLMAYLATITVAIPIASANAVEHTKPLDNLIFAYGGGIEKGKRKQCNGDPTNLQCWQR
ncbi:hypothetical protein TMatcc_001593 [Talaromyces marneffei ATCC 18224]